MSASQTETDSSFDLSLPAAASERVDGRQDLAGLLAHVGGRRLGDVSRKEHEVAVDDGSGEALPRIDASDHANLPAVRPCVPNEGDPHARARRRLTEATGKDMERVIGDSRDRP